MRVFFYASVRLCIQIWKPHEFKWLVRLVYCKKAIKISTLPIFCCGLPFFHLGWIFLYTRLSGFWEVIGYNVKERCKAREDSTYDFFFGNGFSCARTGWVLVYHWRNETEGNPKIEIFWTDLSVVFFSLVYLVVMLGFSEPGSCWEMGCLDFGGTSGLSGFNGAEVEGDLGV